MIGSNLIQSFAVDKMPPNYKRSPNGWFGFNCPACVHNGEPTPDTKKRMGLFLDNNGGLKYHCFRCGFVASWIPGQILSRKLKQIFAWCLASDNEIDELNLECLRIKQEVGDPLSDDTDKSISNHFELKEQKLPDDTKHIEWYFEHEQMSEKFNQAVEYISTRSEHIFEWFDDFQWSPKFEDHIIMPIRYRGSVYGWTARLTRPQKNKNEPKYQNHNNGKFLFNADLLDDERKKHIILVEGPLDAIALNAVAIMGNQITDKQLEWLLRSGKKITVLADKDVGGQRLIDVAIKHGWSVSFPEMLYGDLKDGLDLVNKYGRLMAVKMIFDSATQNEVQITMKRKNWK